jgi:hypothetical protein
MDLSIGAWGFQASETPAQPAVNNCKPATVTLAMFDLFYLLSMSDTSRKSYKYSKASARHALTSRTLSTTTDLFRTVPASSSPRPIDGSSSVLYAEINMIV